MKLANRIRQIRKIKKLTQADIAFKIDISPSAYGQIERKAENTKIETLIKIAKALEVELLYLLDIENPI